VIASNEGVGQSRCLLSSRLVCQATQTFDEDLCCKQRLRLWQSGKIILASSIKHIQILVLVDFGAHDSGFRGGGCSDYDKVGQGCPRGP